MKLIHSKAYRINRLPIALELTDTERISLYGKEIAMTKIPRKELEHKLSIALRMLLKIAGEKETWTVGEVWRVIKDIASEESKC